MKYKHNGVKMLACILILGSMSSLLFTSSTFAQTQTSFTSEEAIDGYIAKWGRPYPPEEHTDVNTGGVGIVVGQWREKDTTEPGFIYGIERGYVSFDTYSLPDFANIVSATLKLKTKSIYSTTDFTIYVLGGQQPIYGGSLEAADWNCGTIIVNTWNTADYPGDGVYIELSIPSEQVNTVGRTQFELKSNREGTSPTGDEDMSFYSGNSPGNEPKLEIDYFESPPTPPTAAFSATPTSGLYPLTVSFADQSTGVIDVYSWNFGDGTTSYARNPTHEYSIPGTYTVSLTVTGPGGYDTETKTDYITVNDLPHGIIDSDMVETDKLKLSALMYHDGEEADPDYDFYSIKVTLEDKEYKNDPHIGPCFVDITVEMSDFCEEVPSNHKPEAGDHGEHQSPITYNFYFISFNLQIPAYWVDYTESHEGGLYRIKWSLRPSALGLTGGILFNDYAEFAVGVRVPQLSKPYANVYAECIWFKKTWFFTHYEWWVHDWDEVGWAVVDPPGADPVTPIAPPPIDAPEILYSNEDVAINNVTCSPTAVKVGQPVIITVQAENQGDICTFNVTTYYDSIPIGTQTVTNLTSGDFTTLTFTWGTAGVPAGNYTIKAVASTVPGETDTDDNTCVDGTITLSANSPPNTPSTPSGKTDGKIGSTYTYTSSTTDPDGDNVRYEWHWGTDFNSPELIDCWYPSGAVANASHMWASAWTWYVRVRAQDTAGLWSDWSPSLEVTISGQGGGGCVAEGTLITMADGSSKPVEEIEKGDTVLGFDPTTGSFLTQEVLAVTSTKVELIENINDGALRLTTTDQPIYIRNSTYEGWLRDPEKIEVGWEIFDAEASIWVAVTSITYEEGKTRVYDFITDGYQTYLANSYLLMDKGKPK